MTFFWRHKFFTLVLIAIGAYIYYNPSGQFGYIGKKVIVYNRMPIAFFDVYIDPQGKTRILDDINDPAVLKDWWSRIQKLTSATDARPVLLVGTGPTVRNDFLPEEYINGLHGNEVQVRILSTPETYTTYNTLKSSGKKVAALIRVQQ